MRIRIIVLLTVIGAVIVLGGCSEAVDTSVRTAGKDSGLDMQADTDTDELTINTQLFQYLNITYAQFKEQVGTEAEFYHGLYFQAPISGKDADAVFLGSYDDEVAGSVLSDEDKSFRVESSLGNIISGITKEMTVAEFMEMLDMRAGFTYEMHPEIQEGLTAYYVAYHYVEANIDSNGDDALDIQLCIALDEADQISPDAPTWLYESSFFENSVQDDNAKNADMSEIYEQDSELINMGIHNNEHNIYMGNVGNEEIRMVITRTEDSLSAAYITRDDEEKVFQGELKKDSAGFILNTDSGEYLEGSISAEDNGGINISGKGIISGNEVVFALRQDTFFQMDEDMENYYSSLGYDAEAVERFAKQIKDSINDKTAFAQLIQYPIFIEVDGSQIMIKNEEGMIDIYDRLMEQNGFQMHVENIFTKYMFANYHGICVEDGIIWFSLVGPEGYKITAINPPQYSPIQSIEPSDDIDQELKNLMTLFYMAYFNKDIDTIEQYLAEGYQGDVSVVGNEINSMEDIEIIEVKGWKNAINKDNIGDECELSLEFKFPNEDSYTYLTVDFIKEDSGWKITWYGLEK